MDPMIVNRNWNDNQSSPLHFVSGGIWKTDSSYSMKRQNRNDYLFLYTISGEGHLTYKEQEYSLLPNTAFLIDCNLFHAYQTVKENWSFAYFHFRADSLKEYVSHLCSKDHILFRIPADVFMENRIRSLLSLFQTYNTAANHQAFAQIADLLALLYRIRLENNPSKQISPYTNLIIDLIEKRYAEKLTLDEIAKALNYNKFYLSHCFKNDMGLSIYEYLTRTRITKSKILLENTNLPISAIAVRVGYDSISNYVKTFSKYETVSPNRYRKQLL